MQSRRLIAFSSQSLKSQLPVSLFADMRVVAETSASGSSEPKSELHFTFDVQGDLSLVALLKNQSGLSSSSLSHRRNDLWKSTCFEAFWGAPRTENYFELNVNPLGFWNLYSFTGYRQGIQPFPLATAPLIKTDFVSPHEYRLNIIIPMGLTSFDFEFNLTSVVQLPEPYGIQHFAIQHSAAKPDFHDRSCFINYEKN